jgi:phosphoethanolamine N-methyltransferase
MTEQHDDEYTDEIREVLQMLWGEGMLSPGGESHLDAIVKGLDLQDMLVLDIGWAELAAMRREGRP